MDITRLRQGEKIAGVSAILLFIFMFFDWYGVKGAGSLGSGNAWDWLDVIPIILVIGILAVLAMVVVRANNMEVDLPVSLSVVATGLAALGTLLILFRIIDPPGGGSVAGVDLNVDVTRKFGVFLALIAAAAMTYGSWRTMEEEGTSFGDAADRLGGGGSGGGDVGGGPPDVGAGPGDPGGGGAEPPSAPPPPPPPPPP
ncbi:MAG: hypothetical protein M3R23_05385, partial [Actinomycetota bacterium]|nr:hypothetical protein [Actinomycetota bacterium]